MGSHTRDQLQEVLDKYPRLGSIAKLHLFTSGTDNTNYYTKTDVGEFVVKLYSGMNLSLENIQYELEIMDCCYKASVKTPHVLHASDGKLYVEQDGYWMVMDFVDAQNMKKKNIDNTIVFDAGVEIGKMDTAMAGFKDEGKTRRGYIFDVANFLYNEPNLALLPTNYSQEIFREIFAEYKRQKNRIEALPKGIIHNDVTLHNLLVKDNSLKVIVDFSDFAFSPYVHNIAVAMSQLIFTYNWQPHQAGLFVKGYRQNHSFSDEEADLLYFMTCMRYLTLIVEFNRWNVQNLHSESATEFVVDNYKFLQDFMKIGKKGFDALIV